MADSTVPEVGDQVSWAYGGGRPGGEVAEKKDEGEIAIQSKRGNTIKRNAEPENPAVHVTRPGNDVVKRQSELDVEEKTAEGGEQQEKDGDANYASAPAVNQNNKPEEKTEGGLEVPSTNGDKEKSKSPGPSKSPAQKKSPASKGKPQAIGKKRKAEEEQPEGDNEAAAAEEPPAKKARGRPKGTTKDTSGAASKGKKTTAKETAAPKKAEAPKEAPGDKEPAKKGRGRPKGSGSGAKAGGTGAKKDKKAPAKAVNGTVGSRTRSTKK
ncbi:MAG: hypothetical protein Q9219_001919 [cf. Caloplaca sp. 3 TL-2023]